MIQTALIGFLMLVWLVPFGGIYLQDRRANVEYSLDELRPIQDTLWQVSRERGLTKPIVSARKQYLPYLAGARFVPLPYSDYDALLRYCKENDVDFLFLQHRELVDFPFMDQFRERMQSDELELVYSGRDGFGERMELYLIP